MKTLHIRNHKLGRLMPRWGTPAGLVATAARNLGYTITKDNNLVWAGEPINTIEAHTSAGVNLYTNCTIDDVPNGKSLFLGMSGPLPGYFTVDKLGVWPWIEPTYKQIDLDLVDLDNYPHELINSIKEQKKTLFHSKIINKGHDSPEPEDLPDDHILILVSHMDNQWKDGWAMFGNVVSRLKWGDMDYPVVIKFDPRLTHGHDGMPDKHKQEQHKPMMDSLKGIKGVTIYTGAESLHDILPKTRACIMDECTQFLEPFMYEVPIITYSAPPYHRAVKKIEHQHELIPALHDISWYSKDLSNRWLTWYLTSYVCYDQESTTRRVKELLDVV